MCVTLNLSKGLKIKTSKKVKVLKFNSCKKSEDTETEVMVVREEFYLF